MEDEKWKEAIKEFNQIWGPMKKKYGLTLVTRFSEYRDGEVQIFRKEARGQQTMIIRVESEEQDWCFRRAVKELQWYDKFQSQRRQQDKEAV